jgi:hypothetical protein
MVTQMEHQFSFSLGTVYRYIGCNGFFKSGNMLFTYCGVEQWDDFTAAVASSYQTIEEDD